MTIRSLLLIAAVLVVLPAAVWAGPISGFYTNRSGARHPRYGHGYRPDLVKPGVTGLQILYLTAGPNLEMDPVFARIDAVPEPATLSLIGGGLILVALLHRKPRR